MTTFDSPRPSWAPDFTGRVAVVTGGAEGVARGISRAFLGAGADVVVCGRHEVAGDGLPSATDGRGRARTAVFVSADIREPDQASAVIEAAVERFGRIDTLVNGAGGPPPADTGSPPARRTAAIVDLDLLAPLYCAQAANARMQDQEEGGSIVNVISVSRRRPSAAASAHAAAHAGLINLTQSLAVEWGPKVRVNTVSAGLVATGAVDRQAEDAEATGRVVATVPLGRLGTPEEVAEPCLFLASPWAAYVTGANLVVNGGGEWPAFFAARAAVDAPT